MFLVLTKPEADDDILDAAEWYESQQHGLGNKFLDDLETVFRYLESNPKLFPEKSIKARQAPLSKFPYVVVFRIENKTVFVHAVFNCYQNPKKKKARFK